MTNGILSAQAQTTGGSLQTIGGGLEYDLCAALMFEGSQFHDCDDITPDVFSDPALRQLYMILFDKRGLIGLSAVRHILTTGSPAQQEAYASLGGDEGLTFMASEGGEMAGPVAPIVEQIKESWTKREIKRVMAQYRLDGFPTATEYADFLSRSVGQITTRFAGNGTAGSLITAADELWEEWTWARDNEGMIRGIRVGMPSFDRHVGGYIGGQVILRGGHSGEGKTQSLAFEAYHAVTTLQDHLGQIGVDFYSLEMTRTEMLKRWVSLRSGVDLRERHIDDAKRIKVREAIDFTKTTLAPHLFVHEGAEAANLNTIIKSLRRGVAERNVKIAFIDYAQLVQVGGNSERYEQFGSMAAQLKYTAQELNIPIIIATQLNREALKEGAAGRPRKHHIAESMALYRVCDHCLFTWVPANHLNGAQAAGMWGKQIDGSMIAVQVHEKARASATMDDLYLHFDPRLSKFAEVPQHFADQLRSPVQQAFLQPRSRSKITDPAQQTLTP